MPKKNYIFIYCQLLVWVTLLPIFIATPLLAQDNSSSNAIVVGYLPYYRMEQVSGTIFNHLTHLNYFILAPNSKGELGKAEKNGGFTPLSQFPQFYKDIETLKRWRGKLKTKIFLVLGGWYESDYFDEMAASASSRSHFISNVKQILEDYQLDGVDFDWEGYKGAVDNANYQLLLTEMEQAFKGTSFEISVAIACSHTSLAPIFKQIQLSHIGLMSYGRIFQDEMQVSINQLKGYVNDWIKAGIKAEQLVAGVPFYACTPADYSAITYQSVISKYNPAPSVNKITHNNKIYYYNGVDVMKAKAQYVLDAKLKGIMIWEVGQDTDPSHSKSLLKAINEVIPVDEIITTVPTNATAHSIQFFPNPFQNQLTIQGASNFSLRIFNQRGVLVHAALNSSSIINTSHLKTGFYFIQVITPQQTTTYKLLKQ
ncbi:T9SS type A sorting domain-containing protein [Prolixibacteraceae bacterium JC049]|nr:T9SS type A sorting domain-containing protein [Prolixibacteraceae bacterium JC049]